MVLLPEIAAHPKKKARLQRVAAAENSIKQGVVPAIEDVYGMDE